MAKLKNDKSVFNIRPAARHILTIGRGLVKDNATALLELVKNSYDADAENVSISFCGSGKDREQEIKIIIQDDGHGMSFDVVTGVWMVPSTIHKVDNKISEKKKRVVQGRKGIGRYSAAILGDFLFMETTRGGETTSLVVDWTEFEKKEYLEDVEILVSKEKTKKPAGTTIEIRGDEKKLVEWNREQIDGLIRDLKRLVSPLKEKEIAHDFKINLHFKDFPVTGFEEKSVEITPFPILEHFDYRIYGEVSDSGEAKLVFENGATGIAPEKFTKQIRTESVAGHCGKLKIDFKIYDQDVDSINNLITKLGDKFTDPDSGEKLGKREARALLKQISGIAVYRGGFRIRPHGDPGYDWLELDRVRVQNPGVRVGSERVSGFVEIETEEVSGLEEKSNREGLKENQAYDRLVEIAIAVLLEAENRRYEFKRRTGKEKSKKDIGEKLSGAFDFSEINKHLREKLEAQGVSEPEINKITGLLEAKAEEGNKMVEDVKRIITIYQGQATLGKIVKIVLHEGRNPISYFQNQIPLMEEWLKDLKSASNRKTIVAIKDALTSIKDQSVFLVSLFNKITPLASSRRNMATEFDVRKIIDQSVDVFTSELNLKKIKITIDCPNGILIKAWPDDFRQTFVNLLDNSLYWVSQNPKAKEITISSSIDGGTLKIAFKDNGPGIEANFIRDELIFEPGFSTRADGTGLGLAIAGEAMGRSGGKLAAIYSTTGAHFEIEVPISKNTK